MGMLLDNGAIETPAKEHYAIETNELLDETKNGKPKI